MNYSIHEMRTFAAVAETGNQSAAAKRCGLTPAAISAIVKRLELALGVRLFERSVPSPHAHYLCWRTGTMERWECATFADWLKSVLA